MTWWKVSKIISPTNRFVMFHRTHAVNITERRQIDNIQRPVKKWRNSWITFGLHLDYSRIAITLWWNVNNSVKSNKEHTWTKQTCCGVNTRCWHQQSPCCDTVPTCRASEQEKRMLWRCKGEGFPDISGWVVWRGNHRKMYLLHQMEWSPNLDEQTPK